MKRKRRSESENFVWISFSDLLTTLLLAFIVIAVASMAMVKKFKDPKFQNAVAFKEKYDVQVAKAESNRKNLSAVNEVVRKKLLEAQINSGVCQSAGIEINEANDGLRLFVANSDDSLWFKDGGSTLSSEAQNCLAEFSDLWIKSLLNSDFRTEIHKIVIEGHSNSRKMSEDPSRNFLMNLGLSQSRALAASEYMLTRQAGNDWLRHNLMAVGKSYNEVIMRNGQEDFVKSKRLEFRVELQTLKLVASNDQTR